MTAGSYNFSNVDLSDSHSSVKGLLGLHNGALMGSIYKTKVQVKPSISSNCIKIT